MRGRGEGRSKGERRKGRGEEERTDRDSCSELEKLKKKFFYLRNNLS